MSKSADVNVSLPVDFSAIQSQCPDLTLQVIDKAGNVFYLALQSLEGLQFQTPVEIKAAVVALKVMEVELSGRVHLLEDHSGDTLMQIVALSIN